MVTVVTETKVRARCTVGTVCSNLGKVVSGLDQASAGEEMCSDEVPAWR